MSKSKDDDKKKATEVSPVIIKPSIVNDLRGNGFDVEKYTHFLMFKKDGNILGFYLGPNPKRGRADSYLFYDGQEQETISSLRGLAETYSALFIYVEPSRNGPINYQPKRKSTVTFPFVFDGIKGEDILEEGKTVMSKVLEAIVKYS